MDYNYEYIEHNADLPFKIFTHTVEQFPYHWHEDLEILFILKGSMIITVAGQSHELKSGDLFVINSNEVHFIRSLREYGGTQILALQFNLDHFHKYKLTLETQRFALNPNLYKSVDKHVFARLRYLLANMMNIIVRKEEPRHLLLEKSLLDIIIILVSHFAQSESQHHESDRFEERLLKILKYLTEHAMERDLSIQDIADHFYLNPQYLSRYFKSRVGTSIKRFIDNIRMSKSLPALQLSKDTVMAIALDHGFPDAKAYYRVFKEIMGMTPNEYRENHSFDAVRGVPANYFSINSSDALSNLFSYLVDPSAIVPERGTGKALTRRQEIKCNVKTVPFDKNYMNLCSFGYAPHGLRADFMRDLKRMQREIGFSHIRFHGIFADQMRVYNKKADGSSYFNFTHIDSLLDNLLSAGIKPFIELGFMPIEMAENQETIFWWKASISPPARMEEWLDLLNAFFRHILDRYGADEVLQWYFEFWNEPEIPGFFWSGSDDDFFRFFLQSFKTIKAIDSRIRLGGFGNVHFGNIAPWMSALTSALKNEDIRLDFFSFHIYNLNLPPDTFDDSALLEMVKNSYDSQSFVDFVRARNITLGDQKGMSDNTDFMTDTARNSGVFAPEYWITEWNANTDPRDLIHDTCFMAPFIVSNVLKNSSKVKGMAFWTFSDIFEERSLEMPLFHGGFGLMTYNGIPKAGYNAWLFLSRLGDEKLFEEEGIIVTRKGDEYRILLYNYVHYNSLYERLDYSQISPTRRYDVFEAGKTVRHKIKLTEIEGECKVVKQRVNRQQGSAFDAWVRMGAPEDVSGDALKLLQAAAIPSYETWRQEGDGILEVETLVDPHEIQLITISKLYNYSRK